jgi:hypothetical protein
MTVRVNAIPHSLVFAPETNQGRLWTAHVGTSAYLSKAIHDSLWLTLPGLLTNPRYQLPATPGVIAFRSEVQPAVQHHCLRTGSIAGREVRVCICHLLLIWNCRSAVGISGRIQCDVLRSWLNSGNAIFAIEFRVSVSISTDIVPWQSHVSLRV